MSDRLDLHAELLSIMGNGNVYFQPPQNIRLSYPCCIYSLDQITNYNANNGKYFIIDRYSVTLITKDPEDQAFDAIFNLDYCSFDHHFTVDNLHHFEFVIKRNRDVSND